MLLCECLMTSLGMYKLIHMKIAFLCSLPSQILNKCFIFSYDHQKYQKWGTVHAIEMHQLPQEAKDELDEGSGVRWRDNAPFTSVDHDHAVEWVNKAAKSSGGLENLTHNDSASLK